MTTKPHARAPLPSRRRASVRSRPAAEVLPTPDRIAFLGVAQVSTETGNPILVQSLCWPMLPTAWTALSQVWQGVSTGRGEPAGYVASNKPHSPSWISACAPQLGAPFRDTTAEESSVAALLLRTPMQVAITIQDPGERQGVATPWQALSDCLAIYDQFVSQPGRRACSLLVSSRQSHESEQGYLQEFLRCRAHMPDAVWLRNMQLRFWKEPVEPLPLEMAHIVAASVARHQLHEGAANPIFDAVLTKLAHNSVKGKRFERRKRR